MFIARNIDRFIGFWGGEVSRGYQREEASGGGGDEGANVANISITKDSNAEFWTTKNIHIYFFK